MTATRAALAIAAIAGATALPLAQGAHFTVRHESVRIDALVTKGGKPVTNLGATDFDVFDNGVRQSVDFASLDALPTNVVLTLDMSNSVSGDRLSKLRDAGRAVLAALEPDDRAALVTFTSAVVIDTPLTSDVGRVRMALDRAGGHGETSLVDATYAALVAGESDSARSLVIVCSDGVDSSSWLAPDGVVDAARRGMGVVYAIVDGHRRRPPFLDDLAKATGGAVIEIEGTAEIEPMFAKVLAEFRQRYLIGYSPSGMSPDGWHRLEIRVKGAAGRGVTVVARPGYQAGGGAANH